jgi:hypothetical protein
MSRRQHPIFRAAAAAALVLLGVAMAQAETRTAADYFPLRLHDSWRYRSSQAAGSESEFTLTVVSEKKQPDGSVLHCVELTNPKPLIQDWYAKTPKAVLLKEEEYLGGGGKVANDPPRPLLQLPLRPGATWSWSGTARAGVHVEESNEVVKKERIETPAGRFNAVKLVTKIEQGGVHVTKTSWFAAGVGLVRQATDSSGVTSTTDLIDYSFKPRR